MVNDYIGHGVKQRAAVRMTPEEIEMFLAERHSMTMSTINADGSIHSVGMWYGFLEGAVGLESKAKAQKVLNLRRNPNITLLVEDGHSYEELRGVSIIGKAEIVADQERMWELGVSVFSRYNAPYTEAMRPAVEAMLNKRVVVKVIPTRIVSWDHRKLGLKPSRTPVA
ncbi:pyridoxamine 5'-phosphate oxidase family protein [Yinghuangia aomiensis]|uniref:pyridoxamine 5'-phosphate oxidase family protein n=1 Tax=Yinghuangia aomiensis TaxID=676205 RepID=UPI0031EDD203